MSLQADQKDSDDATYLHEKAAVALSKSAKYEVLNPPPITTICQIAGFMPLGALLIERELSLD